MRPSGSIDTLGLPDVPRLEETGMPVTGLFRARARWTAVRATPDEQVRPLPGDDLITTPLASLTHAITIRQPARNVWPWLAQMGAGSRAGWYSYDLLDNRQHRSANRIIPELQHLTPGTIFPALPGVTDCFIVLAFEPERYLVLGWRPDERVVMTWAFVLEDLASGSCRLMVRARVGEGYHFQGLSRSASLRVGRAVHFIMQRKQLLGIKRRAESMPRHGPLPAGESAPAERDAA